MGNFLASLFVLDMKNVKDSCSSLCVPTLLTGMDDQQRRGTSSISAAIAVFLYSCRPSHASFAFLPFAVKGLAVGHT